jgi:membrane associated rhomboid family serine protease
VFPLRDNVPTDRFPVVTVALILINVLAYFLWQRGGILDGPDAQHVVDFGAIPYEFTNPGENCELTRGGQAVECGPDAPDQPPTALTAVTSMFMHGSILHLGGNMLFLWIFGNNVEDSMGRGRFVLFYLLAGLAALAAQIAVSLDAPVPTIGASGAVAGVLGGYLLLYPRARVVTLIFLVFFFTIIEIPAMIVLGLWFLQQLYFGLADFVNPVGEGGGVAYFAHIGGFVFGLALIKVFAVKRKSIPPPRPRRRWH